MKNWIIVSILFVIVATLCVLDGIYTEKVFNHLENESKNIYESVLTVSIEDEKLREKIINLNSYWTEKMDMLSISISRKDLQPISDYIQYLIASTISKNQEDAITYSRLLNYNIIGLNESSGINFLNIL